MPTRWLIFLLSFVSWGACALTDPDCPRLLERIHSVQRLLAETIPSAPLYFQHPESLTLGELEAARAEMLEKLSRLPVSHHRVPFVSDGVTVNINDGTGASLGIPALGTEWLERVDRIDPTGARYPEDFGPLAIALANPRTNRMIDRLEEFGYGLYVDPTLELVGCGGHFWEKTVGIEADASFLTLVHEFAHAEFEYYRIPDFIQLVRLMPRRGKALERALHMRPFFGYGVERLRTVARLARERYPENSIDEYMAGQAEWEDLKSFGYTDEIPLLAEISAYVRWHLLNDLASQSRSQRLVPRELRLFLHTVLDALEEEDFDLASGARMEFAQKLARLLAKAGIDHKAMTRLQGPIFESYRKNLREQNRAITGVTSLVAISLGLVTGAIFEHLSPEVAPPPSVGDHRPDNTGTRPIFQRPGIQERQGQSPRQHRPDPSRLEGRSPLAD